MSASTDPRTAGAAAQLPTGGAKATGSLARQAQAEVKSGTRAAQASARKLGTASKVKK
jgi:hypothetical protein